MASCSANGSNGHHKITLNVTQGSQSTANNTTTINYSVVLSPVQNGYDWIYNNSDPFTCTYTINGTTRTCTLRKYDGTSTVTLASGSQTVAHNSDGTKTVNFSFSVKSQSAYYLIGSCSASGSLTLTTIPRASTFTASNGTLGTSQTFTVTRASTSFTHTLTYKAGSATGTIGSAKTTGNLTWTPPTSLAAQNTTGSSVSCTLTLTTYSGNTSIGTSSKTISLTIPAGNPSFTLGTSDTKGYLSTYSGYVKTKSVIRTALTSVSCTYSATVKSYSVTYRKTKASGASLATGSSATTDWTPNWAGTVHITARVTDSRGRYTEKTTTVTVLDYANPTISTLNVGRYSDSAGNTKNDAGDYAKVTYAGTYTSLSNRNSANITIKYKKHSDSTWTTAVNASTTLSGSTPTFAADAGSTYDVIAEIKDNFNTTAITKTAKISTAAVLMHWRDDGNGIAFGKMSEEADAFEVGFTNTFAQNIFEKGVALEKKYEPQEQSEFLYPDTVQVTNLVNSQGMACDGTYLYMTHRADKKNTTVMRVSKVKMSDYSVAGDYALTTGHYNSLYYYNGKLYGTGAAIKSGNTEDYTKVAVTNASSFSTTIKTVPETWGVAIRDPSSTKGTITALYVPSGRHIDIYDSYVDDSSKKQTPLARITLDYTGSTTVQGSIHLTNDYIYVLESAYNEDTMVSGKQVVRCFSYSGMIVRSYYIQGTNEELEDLWVSDDNKTMYVNSAEGSIFKFTLPTLYHTLSSGIYNTLALKQGTIKHIYTNPGALDSTYSFTYSSSTYKVTSRFSLSDYTFLSEIGYVQPVYLYLNSRYYPGRASDDLSYLYFTGSYAWSNGDELFFGIGFTRGTNSSGHNYDFYLSNISIYARDVSESSITAYNESSSNGNLSNTSSGMGLAFKNLFSGGWLNQHMYVVGVSYICGTKQNRNGLGLL